MNKVNPTAIILSGALMLRYLGQEQAADLVYNATVAVIGEGKTVTAALYAATSGPTVWYEIDDGDDNLLTFVSNLGI